MASRARWALAALGGILLAFPLDARAQDIELGLSLGSSGATAKTDADVGEEAVGGFTGGVFIRLGSSGGFGLQAGSRFVQKGVGFQDGGAEIKLSYLEQPILALMRWGGDRFTGSLQGGGAFAREIDCEASLLNATEDCGNEESRRKWDYSLVFGGDVGLRVGDGFTLALALQYSHGLRNIVKDDTGGEFKNRAATLELTLSKLLGS